jgi:hypothetical protein
MIYYLYWHENVKVGKDTMAVLDVFLPAWTARQPFAIGNRRLDTIVTMHGSPTDPEGSQNLCLRLQAALQGQQCWVKRKRLVHINNM